MGYDTSLFVVPVHRELICSICYGVFEKPVYLPLCRHVFCTECISNWLNQSNQPDTQTCPIDKTPIKLAKEKILKKSISYALSNIISDQIVRCKYHNNGCERTLSLSSFGDHIKSCKHKPTDEVIEQQPTTNTNDNTTNDTTAMQVTTPSPAQPNQQQSTVLASAKKSNNTPIAKSKKTKRSPKCKLLHPPESNSKTYFNQKWSHGDEKLAELELKGFPLSYRPYHIAGYIKNLIDVDTHCVHTKSYEKLDKNLNVFILEKDVDKVLNHQHWPAKISITHRSFHKECTIKGSLIVKRGENFYGLMGNADEKTKRREMKKVERAKKKSAKQQQQEQQMEIVSTSKATTTATTQDQQPSKKAKTQDQQPDSTKTTGQSQSTANGQAKKQKQKRKKPAKKNN